jgi:hypothetical protein
MVNVRGAYSFILKQLFERGKIVLRPNELDLDQVHEGLEFVTRLFDTEVDALLVCFKVVIIDYL